MAAISFDNTTYVLLGRQNSMFKEVETLSNNIANANTPGFQRQSMIFEKVLHNATHKDVINYSRDVSTVRNVNPGDYKSTGNKFDVALVGQGVYFRVNTPQGERYTRGGNFTLNAQGQLVTPQGYQVLNNGGEAIVINDIDQDIVVREDGTITAGPEVIGNIGIAQFENEQFMQPRGNGLLEALVDPLPNAANFQVYQGVLELSNVEPIVELTTLIDAQRNVSTGTTIINSLDEMEKTAFRIFGKVS
ncbi:MAG: flagellar basal-body rod protein FlgF [Alphaproteobacteria bacterium 33-17]|nr:MAG: flagellar basal-body rod protein FlgF [Alphaproteobacteria bacterium 33-17]